MAEFDDTGVHCAEPYCNLRDFLPFTCQFCEKYYCIDHYKAESHSCRCVDKNDRRVLICPLCLSSCTYTKNENPNEVFEIHRQSFCQPSLYEERKKIQKGSFCPVQGCKQRLTAVSRYKCKKCNKDVCMKHRSEFDHLCNQNLQQKIVRKNDNKSACANNKQKNTSASQQKNNCQDNADSVKSTADRRKMKNSSSQLSTRISNLKKKSSVKTGCIIQ